ncbi:MAG TPA: FecR domain-containing protein [Burkholderiales bacterium]|nr:FecR domain-containing protein [Burkholderiales bacterium]
MKLLRLFLVFAFATLCQGALAQVAATVEGVQMPAWLERSGVKSPLLPGMELKAGDKVITGGESRAVIKLSEGSLVKLGANGQLRFVELNATQQLFKGALDVLEGAFRFTTDIAGRNRKREVSIRASQVTTGIRGTDVWGKADKDNEVVCLIEGQVEVTAQGEPPVKLDQPLQFFRRVDGKAQPVGSIDKEQLDKWASQVELQRGKGIARAGGRVSVELGRFDERTPAIQMREDVRKAGFPAVMTPIRGKEKTVYVVRIRQLASRAEGQALADQLRDKYGVNEPKVSR